MTWTLLIGGVWVNRVHDGGKGDSSRHNALAGPLSSALGIAGTLWLSCGFAAVSSLALLLLPSVRALTWASGDSESELSARRTLAPEIP